MDFWQKIKTELPDNSPAAFLQSIKKKNILIYDDFFLFKGNEGWKNLKEAMLFLASPRSFSEKDFFPNTSLMYISQTIDGDYICAENERTFIIPVSLTKGDQEVFPVSIIDFFISLESKTLHSKIIP